MGCLSSSGIGVTDHHVKGLMLGRGGHGKVLKGISRDTGDAHAIKCVSKAKPEDEDRLENELTLMRRLAHPNVLKLISHTDAPKMCYLVLELCEGGDLLSRIQAVPCLSESDSATVVQQMCHALSHLHDHFVAHRDVKPDNFLFLERGPITGNTVKISDFGLAAAFDIADPHCFEEKVGSEYYIAPEVLKGPCYGPECDLWSCGVVLFNMLSGHAPFVGNTQKVLSQVRDAKWSFSGRRWRKVSPEAKKLVSLLMEPEVAERLSADAALDDPWLRSQVPLLATADAADAEGPGPEGSDNILMPHEHTNESKGTTSTQPGGVSATTEEIEDADDGIEEPFWGPLHDEDSLTVAKADQLRVNFQDHILDRGPAFADADADESRPASEVAPSAPAPSAV